MGFWDFIKQLVHAVIAAWWNKITEDATKRPETGPEYVVDYPPEYIREYFGNVFTDYRWNPSYKHPVNHLYDNEERFKYRSSKNYNW